MRMSWDGWVGRLTSNERAVANARAASIELSRRRVERDAVELYLRERLTPVLPAGVAPRPA